MAGRVTLAKSVISSIPFYAMQSTKIPMSVCMEIERLQRNFVWGHDENVRKVHTIGWETLCKNKPQGGLGFKRLNLMNDAFLLKVGWKIRTKPENMCCRVLVGKYGRGEDLLRFCSVKGGDSLFWRELSKVWGKLNDGQVWSIGDGCSTFFWTDIWGSGSKSLIEDVNMSIPVSSLCCKVRDMVTPSGGWDLGYLGTILGDEVRRFIAEPVPRAHLGHDRVRWLAKGNGEFSVKSAYDMISKRHPSNNIFKIIWTLNVPERVKIFIWQIAHDRILTRDRCSRWFGSSANCVHCPNQVESTLHVLRDCSQASSLWNKVLDPTQFDIFYNNFNLANWILINLNNSFSSVFEFDWRHVWAISCWNLWRWRNDTLFNSGSNIPRDPCLAAISAVREFNDSVYFLNTGIDKFQKNCVEVTWTRPREGWLKLNTDGARDQNSGHTGCGGLLRNSDGAWILGFLKYLGNCSVLKAECWGLLEGIRCAREVETQDLEIECDSLLMVDAVNDLKPLGAEIDMIVRRIHDSLRNFRRWTLKHKWRESNTCADFLVRMGWDDGGAGEVVRYLQPPREMSLLLLHDVASISFPRVV